MILCVAIVLFYDIYDINDLMITCYILLEANLKRPRLAPNLTRSDCQAKLQTDTCLNGNPTASKSYD